MRCRWTIGFPTRPPLPFGKATGVSSSRYRGRRSSPANPGYRRVKFAERDRERDATAPRQQRPEWGAPTRAAVATPSLTGEEAFQRPDRLEEWCDTRWDSIST
jgi:hypothetical protein